MTPERVTLRVSLALVAIAAVGLLLLRPEPDCPPGSTPSTPAPTSP